jgi:hypothetical protein
MVHSDSPGSILDYLYIITYLNIRLLLQDYSIWIDHSIFVEKSVNLHSPTRYFCFLRLRLHKIVHIVNIFMRLLSYRRGTRFWMYRRHDRRDITFTPLTWHITRVTDGTQLPCHYHVTCTERLLTDQKVLLQLQQQQGTERGCCAKIWDCTLSWNIGWNKLSRKFDL